MTYPACNGACPIGQECKIASDTVSCECKPTATPTPTPTSTPNPQCRGDFCRELAKPQYEYDDLGKHYRYGGCYYDGAWHIEASITKPEYVAALWNVLRGATTVCADEHFNGVTSVTSCLECSNQYAICYVTALSRGPGNPPENPPQSICCGIPCPITPS